MIMFLIIFIILLGLQSGYGHVSEYTDDSALNAFGYDNQTFVLDGKPFRYIAGSIHYFRIHPALWKDRLKRVRAAGLNAIQFYIPWNYHEVQKGKYNFEGPRNVVRFLEIAGQQGLKVLLRVGPYVCGEWENGGLPWWLLFEKDIRMRTADPRFTSEVKKWFETLLPLLVPQLHRNGGPILMVQIENEYGSFGVCDHVYTTFLRDLARMLLGRDVLLYTTDGASNDLLSCATVPEVLPTVDFGPQPSEEIEKRFAIQRRFTPTGPLVNSEFYPGWFVVWGQQSQEVPTTSQLIQSASFMYNMGANFNFYMIHGGTNFGFWNGAETEAPVITSYDYTAPITEAGDTTETYMAIRNWISTLKDWPSPPTRVPPNNPKISIDDVELDYVGRLDSFLLKNIAARKDCVPSKYPRSFEELHHPFGFVLYFTTLKFPGTNLTIPQLKDHGFTSLDGHPQGIFVDRFGNYSNRWVMLSGAQKGSRLAIIVENRGRQTYQTINDFKGILSNVTLDGKVLEDWNQCGIDFQLIHDNLQRSYKLGRFKNDLLKNKYQNSPLGAGIYFGTFTASQTADTFFDSTGWTKGVLLVNGKNMGRYWPRAGPQVTLYVPAPVLRYRNYVLLIELQQPNSHCVNDKCYIKFLDHPIFNFKANH